MIRIGLLSDTHGYIHPKCFEFFRDCDEIWHAGDIGNIATAERLGDFRPLKAVFGNIDGQDIRSVYPGQLVFTVEQLKVAMIHIGGYPGRYSKEGRELFLREKPGLFIAGHSHILKVMFDQQFQCLHINPGAAGKYGMHRSVTMVRFVVEMQKVRDLEVLDIPRNY